MKNLLKHSLAAALFASLLLSQAAFAGECCKLTEKNTKAGKTCEKCETKACCKETAAKVAKDGHAKACEKCAAKEKKS